MNAAIRAWTTEDYPAICAVYNASGPVGAPTTSAKSLAAADERLTPKYRLRRVVLENKGKIIGTARTAHDIDQYNPRNFFINIAVLPEFQGKSMGQILYDHIISDFMPCRPRCVRAVCREDMTGSVHFLEKQGFHEEVRSWESQLDLRSVESAACEEAIGRLRDEGVTIRTLHEVRTDPDWEHRLHQLVVHVQTDMPAPIPYVPLSFDDFMNQWIAAPQTIPDLYFIACDRNRYIGVSILEAVASETRQLNITDTGVHREYRRRGIAMALKCHGIMQAKKRGYTMIRTFNNTINQPMITLNDRLGFVRYPAWISYLRRLDGSA